VNHHLIATKGTQEIYIGKYTKLQYDVNSKIPNGITSYVCESSMAWCKNPHLSEPTAHLSVLHNLGIVIQIPTRKVDDNYHWTK